MIRHVILRLTHRLWNREISRLLCYAYERRLINSTQLHELASWFDPTQSHKVYEKKLFSSGRLRQQCAKRGVTPQNM